MRRGRRKKKRVREGGGSGGGGGGKIKTMDRGPLGQKIDVLAHREKNRGKTLERPITTVAIREQEEEAKEP